ncbi:zinc finger and BTB domain-containing protein 24 [Drosophila albomicans]|uniref:Zinc finger and BTB domain-containing protein 24 n=1 Tax=Drosophila albomicans TaxID=7291 RepID=A0A6P8WV57_DROAB|nr:zinc finger and BTB domain-containing protein 24 [Drosophila albomicans]
MSNKFTPDVAALLPERQYRCELCNDQVFGNQSHYQLHLRRRHKLNTTSNNHPEITSYHCPAEKCIYNADRPGSRGFTNLRFLRQHYQKIHMLKEFKCNECNETFLLERHLEKHQCCSSYPCPICGLTYSSKAGLQTHMRRKSHFETPNNDESSSSKVSSSKIALPTLQAWKRLQKQTEDAAKFTIKPEQCEEIIQPAAPLLQSSFYYLPTIEIPYVLQLPVNAPDEHVVQLEDVDAHVEPPDNANELPIPSFTDEEVERLLRDMETQTDDVDLDTLDMHNEVLAPLLRNIQTQTLDNRHHQGTMTELDLEPEEEEHNTNAANGNYGAYPEQDHIFGLQTSAHMHTQTCDELFEELRNIQTQTLDNRHHQGTMTELDLEPEEEEHNTNAANGNYGAYPEQDQIFGLQTSAHMHTQTCDELFEELGLSHIQTQTHCSDGLYNTQHTQTCDEMLDEFLENFQSTCTQTRWLDWQETDGGSN